MKNIAHRALTPVVRRAMMPRYLSTQKPQPTPLQLSLKMGEDEEEVRYRTQKNPVIPNVDELPKRWNKMDAGQQDDVIAYLEDKMRGDWKELTVPEKQALWYIYYGPWGARDNHTDPGSIYGYFAGFMGVALLTITGFQFGKQYLQNKSNE